MSRQYQIITPDNLHRRMVKKCNLLKIKNENVQNKKQKNYVRVRVLVVNKYECSHKKRQIKFQFKAPTYSYIPRTTSINKISSQSPLVRFAVRCARAQAQ